MSLIYAPINELPFAPNFEGNDYLLIWDVSQPANQARRLTFTALAFYLAYTSREFEWADIINKPDTFPPAIHTHIPADIVGLTIDNLPSGTLIGGVAHFTGQAPPATRRDGSPLQPKDKWEWENKASYNGLLWLGEKKEILLGGSTNLLNGAILSLSGEPNIFLLLANIFLLEIEVWITATVGGTYNDQNHWRVSPLIETSRGIGTAQAIIGGFNQYQNILANQIVNDVAVVKFGVNSLYNTRFYLENLRLQTLITGSPSPMRWIGGKITYKEMIQ